MSNLSKLIKKVAAPLAGIIDPVTSLAGGYGGTAQSVAANNISTGAKGALLVSGGGNIFPGASSFMPGFTDVSPSGGSILDIYLAERRRKDELEAARKAEENKLAEKTAAYNRDVTVAQIQAQSQFYSQLAAAGGPSAAFPGGWLPGSNTLNVPPGNYGSFPNVNSRVTKQYIPNSLSFAPWMLYVAVAAIALVMLPFLVRGK